MCCFLSALWLLGPRFGFLFFWFFPYGRLKIISAFNNWFWPILGLVFLPWTTLVYTLVHSPRGIIGFDWVWLGLGIIADLSAYVAGAARRRDASWYTGP